MTLLRKVVSDFSEDNCPQMAAAIAYYTAFSLAPLLILIMVIAGLIFEPSSIEGKLQTQLSNLIGPGAMEQVVEVLESADRPRIGTTAGVLSFVGLLFGAAGVVTQLQTALNVAWEVRPDPDQGGVKSFLLKRLFSIAMVLGLGFVVVVSLALSTAVQAVDDQLQSVIPDQVASWVPSAINSGVTLLVLVFLFACIFKFIPDAVVSWKDVAVGATITALLFAIGKYGLALYIGSKGMDSAFGAAGSLALLLLWTYYSAMILLLGAEFTQAWATRRGKEIEPNPGAVRVIQKVERTP